MRSKVKGEKILNYWNKSTMVGLLNELVRSKSAPSVRHNKIGAGDMSDNNHLPLVYPADRFPKPIIELKVLLYFRLTAEIG